MTSGRRLAGRLLGARRAAPPEAPGSGPPAVWTPEPPACPPGWETGPPDFVGVGAQRSGTSWWFTLLSAHEAVSRAPASHKEVHFLDRFWSGGVPGWAAEAYHRHFPREPGRIAGEWTPRYMHDVWGPPALARLAPQARLLVLVRDPVERYRSGLAHESAKPRPAGPLLLAGDAFARGLYHQQLVRVLAHFDATRVLVLQYEACALRPAAELARTHAFLGLDPPHQLPGRLTERVNQAPGAKVELAGDEREALVEAYREDTSRLLALCPHLDVGLWPNMEAAAGR